MTSRKETVAVGGLLHDIGKVIYRAEIESGSHSAIGYKWLKNIAAFSEASEILDCLRYHHGTAIRGAKLQSSSPAYIVYIADNIAAGADRREEIPEEGEAHERAPFIRTMPLASVFNLLNGGSRNLACCPRNLSPTANYPREDAGQLTTALYQQKTRELKHELESIEFNGSYINSLLCQLESTLSFIPSSTSTKEVADISLFDHAKITAAAAASICAYLEDAGRTNYKMELLDKEKEFMKEEVFLFFSCDFSGIQKFIYQVVSKEALKSLRSRSFVLEMLMEYLMDEILEECGLSRANLIYTGGGHSYMLLPNTRQSRTALEKFEKNTNLWLRRQFGDTLYLACGWLPVSANSLKNTPAEKSPYTGIYRSLSRLISEKKLRRYGAEELRELNNAGSESGARECKICGTAAKLRPDEELCEWCSTFAGISSEILKKEIFAVVLEDDQEGEKYLNVPNIYTEKPRHIQFKNHDEALTKIKNGEAVRVYSKNSPHSGYNYSTNLYMGDYVYDKDLENLAEEANGVKRIAILRADVDNLGRTFTSGFERTGKTLSAEECERYKTLSRTAALSRQLSMFFKYHLNTLLSGKDGELAPFLLSGDGAGAAKKALIVYSGGDDIFMVGAWDDILESAVDIRNAFKKFTGGALTISAGIAIYPYKYPIYRGAHLAAELEEKSKRVPGKDSLTLFTADEGYTYKWDDFSSGVVPKLRLLGKFLDGEDSERGKAFLYKLLQLLRRADKKINIARCAYLLTRLEPKEEGAKKRAYGEFAKQTYLWITDGKDKGELITAIQIYVYLTRKRGA
ncbi:type III-A CRISPR-associated protein Cas10/Csm1 [Cloacibacillus evryensis]|uniref:type III-A CRISPR-associated protein Cas10/Csm1 n=1 Tax=Cloacibacillus evryensis TaxID=508460 RepID=UPI0026E0362F|nr:type III-A CRISPR-associated protein Cas10/Csm1 [Cloacibacillus evryensis]